MLDGRVNGAVLLAAGRRDASWRGGCCVMSVCPTRFARDPHSECTEARSTRLSLINAWVCLYICFVFSCRRRQAAVELLPRAGDGEGLHLLAGQRQRDAHVRQLAADQVRGALLQRQRRAGPGRGAGRHVRQRLVHQLESILHGLPAGRAQPVPGRHLVRQHRPRVGRHISRES